MTQQTAPAARPSETPVESASTEAFETVPKRKSWLMHRLFILGKRRRFVVDRSQWRAVLLTGGMTVVLLLALNVSLYFSRAQSGQRIAIESPELAPLIASQNLAETALMGLASLVLFFGVISITVLETHKTAGAALHLGRTLQDLRKGRLNARSRLRSDDNLRELERAVNALARSLGDTAMRESVEIATFADAAESCCGPDEARKLADELRRWADQRHRAGAGI